MTDIAKRIKAAREAKGLTQGELAEMLSISQPSLNRYEKGHRPLTLPLLNEMADIFGTTTDDLLGRV